MIALWKRVRRLPDAERGFTLVELMVVVAIVGTLSAIALPLYANVNGRARVAKAQADVRALVSAVTLYQTHMGALPPDLTALNSPQVNSYGVSAGPFLAPRPRLLRAGRRTPILRRPGTLSRLLPAAPQTAPPSPSRSASGSPGRERGRASCPALFSRPWRAIPRAVVRE